VRFKYYLEGPGWAYAELADHGVVATITASYLSDALGDLLSALQALIAHEPEARCTWTEEPGEFRWVFIRTHESVDLEIRSFREGGRRRARKHNDRIVFRTNQDLVQLVSAIVHGSAAVLDKYGERGYLDRWINHPFPIGPLDDLEQWLALQSAETGRT
jgi:hypothetical protein